MGIKIGILVVYFAIMVGIGLYCRKHATDVKGFVLGGRSVGPWLTAFAYGTSYFSAVVFVGYAGQFGWKYGIAFHLDRSGKCYYWITAGMGHIREKNAYYDAAFRFSDHAGIFGSQF